MRIWLATICVGFLAQAGHAGVDLVAPQEALPAPESWVFTLSHVIESPSKGKRPKYFLFDSYKDPDFSSKKYCSETDDPRGFTELRTCPLALGHGRNLYGWAIEWLYHSEGPEWFPHVENTFTGYALDQKVVDGKHVFDGDLKVFVSFFKTPQNLERAAVMAAKRWEPEVRAQVQSEMKEYADEIEQNPDLQAAKSPEEHARILKVMENMAIERALRERFAALDPSQNETAWLMPLKFPLGPDLNEFLSLVPEQRKPELAGEMNSYLEGWRHDLRKHLDSLVPVVETESLRIYRFRTNGEWDHVRERRLDVFHGLVFTLNQDTGRVRSLYYRDGRLYLDPKDFRDPADRLVTNATNTSMSMSLFPRWMYRVDTGLRELHTRQRGIVDYGSRTALAENSVQAGMVKWILFPGSFDAAEFWANDTGTSLRRADRNGNDPLGLRIATPRASESNPWAFFISTLEAESVREFPFPASLIPDLEKILREAIRQAESKPAALGVPK